MNEHGIKEYRIDINTVEMVNHALIVHNAGLQFVIVNNKYDDDLKIIPTQMDIPHLCFNQFTYLNEHLKTYTHLFNDFKPWFTYKNKELYRTKCDYWIKVKNKNEAYRYVKFLYAFKMLFKLKIKQ